MELALVSTKVNPQLFPLQGDQNPGLLSLQTVGWWPEWYVEKYSGLGAEGGGYFLLGRVKRAPAGESTDQGTGSHHALDHGLWNWSLGFSPGPSAL